MNRSRTTRSARSIRPSEGPLPPPTSTLAAHAIAGSLTIDGDLVLARHPGQSESLSVTHGVDAFAGPVTGLRVRGDVILGRTPSPESATACGFLTVAGGVSRSAPPALVVDGAIQSPPRASMLFVLRGDASAGMIALWSGHLLGDGRLSLHDGARGATHAGPRNASGGAPSRSAGAIGAFFGPNLTLEPFGCDAVPRTTLNRRLPQAAEYGEIEFDMGVVLRESTLRLRIGDMDRDGRSNDRLVCRGTLHLGRAHLEVSSAFTDRPTGARAGDRFTLVEAGSIGGDLRAAALPEAPRGLRYALERTETRIVLRAVRRD